MPLYTLDTDGHLEPHLHQEWLITNGIGGFASSSVVGCNTRRYHGLLCAATKPPGGRIMALNRIGEILMLDDRADPMLELSINQFGGRFHPRGDQYLRRFELDDGVARWFFQVEGVRVCKELQMRWNGNAAGIRYTIEPPEARSVEMWLLPFVSLRDFHGLRRGGTGSFKAFGGGREVAVTADGLDLNVMSDLADFQERPDWWYGHTYSTDGERGLDDREDLFVPGRFVLKMRQKTVVTLWASLEPIDWPDWDQELRHRRSSIAAASDAKTASAAVSITNSAAFAAADPTSGPSDIVRLSQAANDFIVARKAPDGSPGHTILAGYPWFADWGRDTMISLPGLLLVTGRFAQARQVLCLFAQFVSEGMIPNRFDDYTNEPSYNTVDASLWFIHAAYEYLRWSKDQTTFDALLRPACLAIVDGYKKGTRYGIRMDASDGLITQGDPSTQLTWMDAKCEGITFTPRQGKPVEINALWYHALKLTGDEQLAQRVAASFRAAFWISPFRGLADVVSGTPPQRDTSLRPNQIFAASLANSPLTPDQQFAVVEVVRRELLTPMGLRTLVANDGRYKGRYTGPQVQRDAAYHNGTVWAWLMGAFLEAYLRVNHRSPESIAQARLWLRPLLDSMANSGCIGQISEIFEGDPPHRPVGCFAQAWSVAEILRLAHELEREV